ncbi:hypothetical protein [Nisaea sediminum]|uniref:hypothetical protein n=1 Tax=Nisaea sediminum TaxID=2775867 RepID=UPI001866A68E|nr:hypothetical protein [Nisaea sediminum]
MITSSTQAAIPAVLNASQSEGKNSDTNKTSGSATSFSDLVQGLESHAMYPGWMGVYLPKVSVLNNPDSTKVGYAAWEQSFRSEHRNELSEYSGKLKQYFAEASTRTAFEQSVSTDARMLELMDNLEIRRPF